MVFGENLSGQPGSVYTISLREYEIEPNPDPIIVRVGEPVIFRLVNEGAVEHEFMFVMDIEQMASMIEKAAIRLANERPDLSEEEIITMVLEVHDEAMLEMIEKTLGNVIIADTYMVELEPGESEVLRVTFREPGIYVVACFEMEGTSKPHASSGMFNQIIVVEG